MQKFSNENLVDLKFQKEFYHFSNYLHTDLNYIKALERLYDLPRKKALKLA